MDGKGAMKSGGRWNRPGLGPVLYCSLQPGAAAEEGMRLFEAAGFKRSAVKPRLIVGIRYRLSSAFLNYLSLNEKIHYFSVPPKSLDKLI